MSKVPKKIIVELPEERVNTLERLALECESYKDNIAFLLDSRRDDETLLESPNFKKYSLLQIQAKKAYEDAKLELQKDFIPANLAGKKLNWSIPSWADRKMEIIVLE